MGGENEDVAERGANSSSAVNNQGVGEWLHKEGFGEFREVFATQQVNGAVLLLSENSKTYPSSPQGVGEWLQKEGFGEFREVFASQQVNGAVLLRLSRESLAELVPSLGPRMAVLDAIEKLRGWKAGPRHVGEGLVAGLHAFAAKFVHGLDHLLNDPIEGASKEGVSGLMHGLSMGITGAIKHPVEGVAMLSQQLGDGFRRTPDALFGRSPALEDKQGSAPPSPVVTPLPSASSPFPASFPGSSSRQEDSVGLLSHPTALHLDPAFGSSSSVSPSQALSRYKPSSSPGSATKKIGSGMAVGEERGAGEEKGEGGGRGGSGGGGGGGGVGEGSEGAGLTGGGGNVGEEAKPDFLKDEGDGSRPAHIGEGILVGMRCFGSDLYDGLTGIVTEPMKAMAMARDKGSGSAAVPAAAVMRGLAKGLAGAICKPVAGGFELAHATVEGIIATPQTLAAAARDGPAIQDTPTYQRLAALRLLPAQSSEAISRMGQAAQHGSMSPAAAALQMSELSHRGEMGAGTGGV
ncbi:unnamed protein product [Closterium sp. Yama58-4]|nr:unnamed protein product [Closterium sp. Yama58-4]